MFNFPNAPSNGALFTPIAGGPTYTWDAATTAWKLASAGLSSGVYTGDIAPAAPVSGMLWLNSTTGIVYFWYVDPNSSQWVAISGGAPASVKTARTRNRVNNPTAQVSQENGSTAVTVTNAYPADQWRLNSNIAGLTAQRSTIAVTPEGTTTAISIWTSIAKGSLAATDNLQVVLPIEGLDVIDFQWGTANAKPVVLRFAATADVAGTYGFAIGNVDGSRSYCGSFTIATAGVVQVFSFAIPGDMTGTWAKDNTTGIVLHFVSAAGSTFVGVAGWQGANVLAPPGCINGAAQANKGLVITDVGLYSDPDATGVAPRFEVPSYEDDLARCMRYWQGAYASGRLTATAANNIMDIPMPLSPNMRAAPSTTLWTVGSRNNATGTPTLFCPDTRGCRFEIQSAAAGDFYVLQELYKVNARLI